MRHETPTETNPRPATPLLGFRIFIGALLGVLGLVLLFDAAVHHHPHFEKAGLAFDTGLWFFPLYGLAGTLGVVIFAKTLAIALKRKDTYYADD
jgi:hypothetical protein